MLALLAAACRALPATSLGRVEVGGSARRQHFPDVSKVAPMSPRLHAEMQT